MNREYKMNDNILPNRQPLKLGSSQTSRHEKLRKDSVFISRKHIEKTVQGYKAIHDQIISIRRHEQPFGMMIIQVYAPTTDVEEVVDQFYEQV